MTTYNSDVYQGQYVDSPCTCQPGSVVEGRLKRTVAKYTFAGEAAGSILAICRPRAGSRWSALSLMINAALGASTTIAVGVGIDGSGNAAVPAKFLAALDTSSAKDTDLDVLAGVDYVFDGKTDVIATLAGAAATGAVIFEIITANYN